MVVPSKVLLTSVGTGDIKKNSDSDYHETVYTIVDDLSGIEKQYRSTLTSEVMIKHYGIEKVLFVGTNGSMWDNLYFKYISDSEDFDESYLDFLIDKKKSCKVESKDLKKFETSMDKILGKKGTKCLLIDYERNDNNEIWNNFEKLLQIKEFLKNGDEIILDITHGFRYMPILNIFLLEVLSLLGGNKSFNVRAILYGMFSDNKSEIIDFKIFFDLMEWVKAINDFKKNANAMHLAHLLKYSDSDMDTVRIFEQFSQNIQMANMHSLWQFMRGASKKINKIEKSHQKVVSLLSDEIRDLAGRFDKELQSDFQYELAKWFFEGENYALSYIALYEAIITKSCELSGKDPSSRDDREDAKRSIGNDKYGRFFYTKYDNSISIIRNSIVHQNDDRKDMVKQDIEKLKKFIEHFCPYFEIGKEKLSKECH